MILEQIGIKYKIHLIIICKFEKSQNQKQRRKFLSKQKLYSKMLRLFIQNFVKSSVQFNKQFNERGLVIKFFVLESSDQENIKSIIQKFIKTMTSNACIGCNCWAQVKSWNRPLDVLKEIVDLFQKDFKIEAMTLLSTSKLSDLETDESFQKQLVPYLTEHREKITSFLSWVFLKHQNMFAEEQIIKVALNIQIINQSQQEFKNSFTKTENKYFTKITQQMEGITITQMSFIQHLLRFLKRNIPLDKLRSVFRQIGRNMTKINTLYAITCYKLYYQVELTDESKFLLGTALMEGEKIKEGINYLSQINYRKYDLKGLLIMVNKYRSLFNFYDCIKTCIKIIDIDGNTSYYSTVAHYQIASIFQSLLLHNKSIERYRLSLYFNKKNNEEQKQLYWEAIIRIAQIYIYNKVYQVAINLLEKLIDQEQIPFSYQLSTYKMLGKCLKETNNFQKALYYYLKAQKAEVSNDLIEDIGNTYLLMGNEDFSNIYFSKLQEDNSIKSRILLFQSWNLLKFGQIDEAKQKLEEAENMDRIQTVTNKLYSCIIEGIYGANDISKGMLQEKKEIYINHATTLLSRAIEFRKCLKCNQSLLLLQECLTYNPQGSVTVYYQLGMIFFMSQKLIQSIQMFQTVLENEPTHNQSKTTLFLAYIGLQKQERQKYLQRLEGVGNQLSLALVQHLKILQKRYQNQQQRFYVDGVNINILPKSYQKGEYMTQLLLAMSIYSLHQQKKSFEIFYNIFKQFFDDAQTLYNCALVLLHCDFSLIAGMFCKRYFTIKPFDRQAFMKIIKITASKQKITQNSIKQIQFLMTTENTDGEIFFQLAKMSFVIKDLKRAINYSIEAFKLKPKENHFAFLEKRLFSLKYSQTQVLKKIIKLRNDYWQAHERLAKIYRRQNDKQNEVYHLQQTIKYSWNKQKHLLRLCCIFRTQNFQRYLQILEDLATIQFDNTETLMELAQVYKSQNLLQEQIKICNKLLNIEPQQETIYVKFQQIYMKTVIDRNFSCYELHQKLLDDYNRSNLFVLSCMYGYYNKIRESLSYFLFGIQQIYSKNSKHEAKIMLKQKLQWLNTNFNTPRTKDEIMKLYILGKEINEEKIKTDILFRDLLFDHQKQPSNDKLMERLTQLNQNHLKNYDKWQIEYILSLLFDELQQISFTDIQICLQYFSNYFPQIHIKHLVLPYQKM